MSKVCAGALLAIALMMTGANTALACNLLDQYVARLGSRDHYNSRGVRLQSAAAIIRQDRANFHQFGVRDPEDQGDSFFSSIHNRAQLERMLERGSADPGVRSQIIHGTPIIVVRVCAGPRGDYIDVLVH